MKKPCFITLTLLSLGTCLYAELWFLGDPSPFKYNGVKDDNPWTDVWYYDALSLYTTLGLLARYSDVIGVGVVSNRTEAIHEPDHYARAYFTVTVDHAVLGCTNGASIVVYENPAMTWMGRNIAAYVPTNNSRIVFAVYTNDYPRRRAFLETPEIPWPPDEVLQKYDLLHYNRSWWHADRDDGVLFTHFTNVIREIRFQQNWTNYFYLCRDGANSTSNRVREDSFWEMRDLSVFSTDDQAQFILDDPLVDPTHKTLIQTEGWRYKGRLY